MFCTRRSQVEEAEANIADLQAKIEAADKERAATPKPVAPPPPKTESPEEKMPAFDLPEDLQEYKGKHTTTHQHH